MFPHHRGAAVPHGSGGHREGFGAQCGGKHHPGEGPQHRLRLLQPGRTRWGLPYKYTTEPRYCACCSTYIYCVCTYILCSYAGAAAILMSVNIFSLFLSPLDEDPLEKLRKLQREKQCKICMDRDICMVFIPCGHLVSCNECSTSLNKCPICCTAIMQKIKTYIA